MHRTLLISLASLLLADVGLQTQCPAEKPNADTSAAATVVAPERWLDFRLAAPSPLAVRADGRRVVVRAGSETVLYDLESGGRLHAWPQRFSLVRFSGDGHFVLTVQGDVVTVWDAATIAEVRRFTGRAPQWNEPGYPSSSIVAAISDDGGRVAIANRRGSFHRELPEAVLVYETRSGELRRTLPAPDETENTSVALVGDGHQALVCYRIRREREGGRFFHGLWDAKTPKMTCELPAGASVRVSPDGRWIAAGALAGGPFKSGGRPRPDSTSLAILETATGKALRTFEHGSPMRDFAFSPDAERIIAALEIRRAGEGTMGFQGRLIEWDVQSGETRFETDDSPKPYASVAYSPDGLRRLATTEEPNGVDDDVDHRLCGWMVETGARLPIGSYSLASYNGSEDLFFYPKGDRFIDRAAAFGVRDVLTGNRVQTLPEYRVEMNEAAFAPDGEKFLVGHERFMTPTFLVDCASGEQRRWRLPGMGSVFVDGGRLLFRHNGARLYLIDVLSNEIVWTLPLDAHYRRFDAAVSPDAKHVVVSQESAPDLASAPRVILVETSRPDRPRILEKYASAIAFHPDGTRFLAASPEAIDEFDVLSGDRVRTLWAPLGRPLFVAYSGDGSRVLAGGVVGHEDRREPVGCEDQGWAALWDSRTNWSMLLEGHAAPVTTAAFGPGAVRCATGSLDTTIRLWDTATGSPLGTLRGHIGGVHRIAYSPRGDRILSAAEDGAALWNVAHFATSPVEPTPLAASFTPAESVNAIKARLGRSSKPAGDAPPAPAGSRRASTPAKHHADWIVVEVGKVDRSKLSTDMQRWLSQAKRTETLDAQPPVAEAPRPPAEYKFRGASRDGRRTVYVSEGDKTVILCDVEGQVLRSWKGRVDSGTAAISPSGNEVVIARHVRGAESRWLEATVYDTDSGISKRVIREDGVRLSGPIAIGPKERTILIWVGGGEIVVRDYQTGARIGVLGKPEGGPERKAQYSADGRFVAAGKFPDLDVTLYDPATLAPARTLPNLLPVRWFEFSPDGNRLLVGQLFGYSFSDLLTMWEIDSGRRLWSRCGPSDGRIAFSPDGRRFVSDGRCINGRLATVWDTDSGEVLCALLASSTDAANKPVWGDDGASLHLGTLLGPRLWPRD